MKTKAIRDLNQLSDNDLVAQVSEGLELIYGHIHSIEADVKFLAEKNKSCGFNILESVLKEESAKFLILFDAIRCPRVPPDNFTKQLARFNDHLAKGIYSLVYDFRPADFKEIRKAIERECHEYYLDGPNDFDWIFRNEILQTREEQIYVDYVESEGEHFWLSPKRYHRPEMHRFTSYLIPSVYNVASALYHTGCTKPDALLCIANIWRSFEFYDDFDWSKFITLRRRGKKLIESLDSVGPWKQIHIPHAKRKYQNPKVYGSTIELKGYSGYLRQVAMRGNGHHKPTFLISNDIDSPVERIVGDYARRWRVENVISEAVKFFNLNALSSPILTKVHFDVIMTMVADTLYNMLATKLRGFEYCDAFKIYRHFVKGKGQVNLSADQLSVVFPKRAHNPILRNVPWHRMPTKISWLDDVKLNLKFK